MKDSELRKHTTLTVAEMDEAEAEAISETSKQKSNKVALEDSDLRAIMEMPQGRRVMNRILGLTLLRLEPFSAGHPDVTSFNLGKASVGRRLEEVLVQVCFQEYLTMLRENKDKGVAKNG